MKTQSIKIYLQIILITLLCLTTISCHNMCKDMEETIGEVCWYDKLEWKDATNMWSNLSQNKTLNSYYTASPSGVVTATGNSGYINNWMLSQLGMDIKGFEAEIKLTSASRRSGFQIFSTNSYRRYSVYLAPNGTFYFYYNEGHQSGDGDILFQKKSVTENALDYNLIRMEINEDRSTSVYVNDTFICNIPDHQIHYGQYGMTTVSTTSSQTTAYFKIKRVLH